MIFDVITLADEHGRRIEAFTEHGALLPRYARFRGFGGYPVKTTQGPVQVPVQFEIPATSIEEAFKLYDEVGKKACEDDYRQKAQLAIRRNLVGG